MNSANVKTWIEEYFKDPDTLNTSKFIENGRTFVDAIEQKNIITDFQNFNDVFFSDATKLDADMYGQVKKLIPRWNDYLAARRDKRYLTGDEVKTVATSLGQLTIDLKGEIVEANIEDWNSDYE